MLSWIGAPPATPTAEIVGSRESRCDLANRVRRVVFIAQAQQFRPVGQRGLDQLGNIVRVGRGGGDDSAS